MKNKRGFELVISPFSGHQIYSEFFFSNPSPGQSGCFNSKRFLSYLKYYNLIIYASHFMTITPVSTSSENVGQEKGNYKNLNILITKIAF